MRLRELARVLDLERLTPTTSGVSDSRADTTADDVDIRRGYASDLLSDVLGNAPAGGILVTLQVHLNVIAVASHAGLSAVIFSSGRLPNDEVVAKAVEEGITLFGSSADTFELAGRLYELGVRGGRA